MSNTDTVSRGISLVRQAQELGEGYFSTMTVNGKSYYVMNVGAGEEFRPIGQIDTDKVEALANVLFASHHQSAQGADLETVDYIDSAGFHYASGETKAHKEVSLKTFEKQETWKTEYEEASGDEAKEAVINNVREQIRKEIDVLGLPIEGPLQEALEHTELETLIEKTNEIIQQKITAKDVWEKLTDLIIPPIIFAPGPTPSSSEADDDAAASSSSSEEDETPPVQPASSSTASPEPELRRRRRRQPSPVTNYRLDRSRNVMADADHKKYIFECLEEETRNFTEYKHTKDIPDAVRLSAADKILCSEEDLNDDEKSAVGFWIRSLTPDYKNIPSPDKETLMLNALMEILERQ